MFTSEPAERELGAVGFVLVALVACGSEARRRSPTDDGGGTSSSGEAGSSGGAGAFDGRGGGSAGKGERGGASGTPTGGAGGTSIGGSGAASGGTGGASPGGEAGGAGTGDVPEWPSVGEPCSMSNFNACPGPQATHFLTCDGTSWRRANDCGTNQLCDRRTGTCAEVTCDPSSTEFACASDGYHERYCGPDNVSIHNRECAFICREMQGCVEPGDDQVYVDRPRAVEVQYNTWPGALVPVCLENSHDWRAEEIATVRDTFYRTWGRYASIALTELEPCGAKAHGVTLGIADACDLELARIPSTGYPGPGATLPLTLCRSYEDSRGILREVSPELFEHAIVHVFGHVLGRTDERYSATSSAVMMQAIDVSHFRTLPLTSSLSGSSLVASAQNTYGVPAKGSLGGPSGLCLDFVAPSGSPGRTTCDGTPERKIHASEGRLEHVATGKCLNLDAGRVVLGDCADAERWQALRVNWLAYGGRCIAAPQQASAQRPLTRELCSPSRAAEQTFHFEFLAPDRVRIQLVRDPVCVRWPADFGQSVTPALGSCSDTQAVFDTSRGALSTAGRCLTFMNESDLLFAPCRGSHTERFAISGPLESPNGALTLLPIEGAIELRALPLSSPPDATQIFDYYF